MRFHIHFLILSEWKFQRGERRWKKRGKGGRRYEAWDFCHPQCHPEFVLFVSSSPALPLASPLAPFSAAGGRRRGRWLQPPPAAGWKSSSCHLPSRVRMAHFCRIPFGPRGRCGGWVRGALCALAQRHSRPPGGSALRPPVRRAPELGRRRPRATR